MLNTQELRTAAAVGSVGGCSVFRGSGTVLFWGRSQHVWKSANYDTTRNINGNLAHQPFAKRERTTSCVCVVLSVGST